jgi:hypothetical protein
MGRLQARNAVLPLKSKARARASICLPLLNAECLLLMFSSLRSFMVLYLSIFDIPCDIVFGKLVAKNMINCFPLPIHASSVVVSMYCAAALPKWLASELTIIQGHPIQ